MSFANLKSNRSQNFKKLLDKVNSIGQGQNFGEEDPRIWTPTVDKEGNGFAIIRFLPDGEADTNPDAIPFVMIWDHGFQGPGGWYINKSLTSIGQNDPVSEYNTMLWNRNGPGDRLAVSGGPDKSGSKRRLLYYSNVLIVRDPAKPENEGTVRLYRYGKKIHDKIKHSMEPKSLDPDVKSVDPFDMWEGANFRLTISKVAGYRNYDDSKFDSPTCVANGDEKAMESIFKQCVALKEFVDPKNFKTYSELKAQLNKVLGVTVEGETSAPVQRASAFEERTVATKESLPWEPAKVETDDDEDQELNEFRKLVG